jgi:hypothetical protein
MDAPFYWNQSSIQYSTKLTPPKPPLKEQGAPQLEPFETIVSSIEHHRKHRLSVEQLAICRHIYDQNSGQFNGQHMMIDSVAGSGKTSTLLMCLWFLPPDQKVLLLSFNKTVQQTLEAEVCRTSVQIVNSLHRHLPNCSTYTCHAHGLAALKRTFPSASASREGVSDNKYPVVLAAIDQVGCGKSFSSMWSWHLQTMLKLLMNLGVDCSPDTQWSEDFIVQTGKKYGVPTPPRNTSEYGPERGPELAQGVIARDPNSSRLQIRRRNSRNSLGNHFRVSL